MAERERSSRGRRRRMGGATVGSGGEPADPASNRRFQAAARNYEGPRTVAPARRESSRASGAAASDSRQHRRTAAVADGWCGRTGETTRRRAGEEQRHGSSACADQLLRGGASVRLARRGDAGSNSSSATPARWQ
ncbi:hypothetical protein Scep_009274 [Stephania cephalantha]|uniref:Uncharacterized protein n=1 Tax=Stephania cephalantha TaxID=152367 RepID=A0AAP0JU98_9MAGN